MLLLCCCHNSHPTVTRYIDRVLYVTDEYEVIGEAQWQVLETNADDQVIKIYGYKYSKLRAIIFHTVCIILCGLPYFAFAYYPTLHRFKYVKCSLKTAEELCGEYLIVLLLFFFII